MALEPNPSALSRRDRSAREKWTTLARLRSLGTRPSICKSSEWEPWRARVVQSTRAEVVSFCRAAKPNREHTLAEFDAVGMEGGAVLNKRKRRESPRDGRCGC